MLGSLRNALDRLCAFRELRAMERVAYENSVLEVNEAARTARTTLEAGGEEQAFAIWEDARRRYPSAAMKSRPGLRLLVDLKRCTEILEWMAEGRKRFPRDPFFLEGTALATARLGNHEEAIRLFALLRKRQPGMMVGYWGAAESLVALGRLQEAESILARALSIAPDGDDEAHLYQARAQLLMQQKDWAGAKRCWQSLWDDYRNGDGIVGMARCYVGMNLYDEAEKVILGSPPHIQVSLGAVREQALLAELRSDWPAAAYRWDRVTKAYPKDVEAYSRRALALAKCGRVGEANSVLAAALEKFPTDSGLFVAQKQVDETSTFMTDPLNDLAP